MQTTDQGDNIFGSTVPLKLVSNFEILATNIVLPNGSMDPWHALGMYKSNTTNHVTPILINGTAHCSDMYPAYEGEPPALKGARTQIQKEIEYFIHFISFAFHLKPRTFQFEGMKLLVTMPIILVAVLASGSEAKKFKKVKREVIYEEIPVGQQQNPSRKFHLKPVQTPYQQCKMECKRQRDAVEAQEASRTLDSSV
uniref:COesterase domain-containing protein n=1 Tax=Heterorhabditis bacteriophora TaxID=37862 RepID=A0A1I7XJF0_HETBA